MTVRNSGYIGNKVKTSREDIETFGINKMFEVYNARFSDQWPFAPTLKLSLSTTFLDETDNRNLEVSVLGSGYPDGTELFWTIEEVSGTIESSDFSTELEGSFQLSGDDISSTASFNIIVRIDGEPEGQDKFVIRIREGSTAGNIIITSQVVTIEDTSTVPPEFSVTGGTVIDPGDGYIYHQFTASDSFTVVGNEFFDYLVVAGGGGAGSGIGGGGGGAGGYLFGFAEISEGTYSVVVGGGGAGGGSPTEGTDSELAIINEISPTGGGAGGYNTSWNNGVKATDGGSGGGGVGWYGSTGAPGSGISGQGNSGGTATSFSSSRYKGAGGGGASQVGENAQSDRGGNGGDGTQWLDGNYYAGGGGGAVYSEGGNPIIATGGLGGGGNGSRGGSGGSGTTSIASEPGEQNTGGGGGASGKDGGSGIVIIRYPI